MFGIELDILVYAVQRRGEELRAKLEQVGPDLAARNGQSIEGIEVDVRRNGDDDPRAPKLVKREFWIGKEEGRQ